MCGDVRMAGMGLYGNLGRACELADQCWRIRRLARVLTGLFGISILVFLAQAPVRSLPPALPRPRPIPAPSINVSGVQRTVYPNGLTLLSKEDHAAPVVSVWVYYQVGARDEVEGIRGISHQCEHMMFKGTELLKPGEIDRLFSQRGGVNNAE